MIYLSEQEGKYYDGLCDKKGYCEIFGTEYIRAFGMRSFFGDFNYKEKVHTPKVS